MRFDNHDARIKYYELLLEGDLDGVPQLPLPEGYRFVFFRPGDRDIWIDIERSAGELTSHAQGVEVWNKYYGGREDLLPQRMVFVEIPPGKRLPPPPPTLISRAGISPAAAGCTGWRSAGTSRAGGCPSR